jgi:hypothetical protein
MRYLLWGVYLYLLFTGIMGLVSAIAIFATFPTAERPGGLIWNAALSILAIVAGFYFRHRGDQYLKSRSRPDEIA